MGGASQKTDGARAELKVVVQNREINIENKQHLQVLAGQAGAPVREELLGGAKDLLAVDGRGGGAEVAQSECAQMRKPIRACLPKKKRVGTRFLHLLLQIGVELLKVKSSLHNRVTKPIK